MTATYTRFSDWLASRPPPPLPRTVTPIHGETLGSYLKRLAAANHEDPDTLRRYLRRPADPNLPRTISPQRLAAATGHPVELLTQRLHRLETQQPPHLDPHVRVACQGCMAERGITELVWCALPAHLVVCPRHHLWLGAGNSSHRHQYDLHQFPEIHRAQRHHLRLRRLNTNTAVRDALDYAHGGIQRILQRALWTPDQQRRIHTLTPEIWTQVNIPPPLRLLRPAYRHTGIQIATYPDLIDLAERFLTTGPIPYQRWITQLRAS